MELKTKVLAEEGKQEILITREFELPVNLLFKAYSEAHIVEQWMGTKVMKLENRAHGGFRFETSDPNGNVVFSANGTVHEFSPDRRIIRTFEMENTPFEPQMEFLEFESLPNGSSKLNMQIVFRTVELRDNLLRMPFAQGLNMAHNRLQEVVSNLK